MVRKNCGLLGFFDAFLYRQFGEQMNDAMER